MTNFKKIQVAVYGSILTWELYKIVCRTFDLRERTLWELITGEDQKDKKPVYNAYGHPVGIPDVPVEIPDARGPRIHRIRVPKVNLPQSYEATEKQPVPEIPAISIQLQ
jgi:hypothetical protein